MPGVDALGWFKGEQFKSAKCFQYSLKLKRTSGEEILSMM